MEDKRKKTLLKEMNEDRKYHSLVSEYKRIINFGRSLTIKGNTDLTELFELSFKYMIKELRTDYEVKDLYYGAIISSDRKKQTKETKVIEYINNDKRKSITLEYVDKNKTKKRISIEARNKLIGKNHKLIYTEWYKGQRTLFGISDEAFKLQMKNRMNYRSSLLQEYLVNKIDGHKMDYDSKTYIKKFNKKGSITW